MMSGHLLEINDVCMRFGGVHAVEHMNLYADRDEILGIIGSNGSGKSTLVNIITGIYKPASGKVIFDHQDITGKAPYAVSSLGLARTFQNLRIFGAMTVEENVLTGSHVKVKANFLNALFHTSAYAAEEKGRKEEAEKLLEFVGLWNMKDEIASSLSYGQQKRLEIARALAGHPKMCLLDEPAAGMNSSEAVEMMEVVKKVHSEYHMGIILIEHNMEAMMMTADRIAVMNTGKLIAQGTPAEIRNDAAVIKTYFGGDDEWH